MKKHDPVQPRHTAVHAYVTELHMHTRPRREPRRDDRSCQDSRRYSACRCSPSPYTTIAPHELGTLCFRDRPLPTRCAERSAVDFVLGFESGGEPSMSEENMRRKLPCRAQPDNCASKLAQYNIATSAAQLESFVKACQRALRSMCITPRT